MSVQTITTIHYVKHLAAHTQHGLGAPLVIRATGEDGSVATVTFFTGDIDLSQRIADAINTAIVNYSPVPDAAHEAAHTAAIILYDNGSRYEV